MFYDGSEGKVYEFAKRNYEGVGSDADFSVSSVGSPHL